MPSAARPKPPRPPKPRKPSKAAKPSSQVEPPANGGGVIIADTAIIKLAGRAARTTYGVVDLHSSPVRKVAELFRGQLTEGVEVEIRDEAAHITLHVIMERGVNLSQVTATLQEQVRYEVERNSGLKVAEVVVHVEDLRE
jgi:uncharacterized alkaline shock family protein YloU